MCEQERWYVTTRLESKVMDIKHFKEKFVDFIDDCNECGVLANIQVQDGDGFGNRRWFVVDKCIIKDGVAILNAVDCAHNIDYKFTDKSIFDNVNKVVFCIKGEMVEDAEYVDASWSDRTFSFEGDL